MLYGVDNMLKIYGSFITVIVLFKSCPATGMKVQYKQLIKLTFKGVFCRRCFGKRLFMIALILNKERSFNMERQKAKSDPGTGNCSAVRTCPRSRDKGAGGTAVLDEVIIETLAIDGICGVY